MKIEPSHQKEKIPDSFFRFYGNPEFALDCIENKQLTLIHTSKFNDPFDPVLDFVLECDWDYDSFIEWVQKNKGQPESTNIQKIKKDWRSSRTKLERLFKDLRTTMFVACFCTPHNSSDNKTILPQNNLYMWGHYGNGHRGVAIEFKKDIFVSSTGEVGIDYIEYGNTLPIITNEELYEFIFNNNNNNNTNTNTNTNIIIAKHRRILRTKTKNWEPEQEWRFCMTNTATKLPWIKNPLPDDAMQSIYLGCRLSSDAADKIIEQAKKNHPNAIIFRAKEDLRNLQLSFEVL